MDKEDCFYCLFNETCTRNPVEQCDYYNLDYYCLMGEPVWYEMSYNVFTDSLWNYWEEEDYLEEEIYYS